MDYPQEILPNIKFGLINCDLSNHHLIRHTPTNNPNELLDENKEFIKDKYICERSLGLLDLSSNLLGIFIPEHIKIKLTTDGKTKFDYPFKEQLAIEIPIYEMDFTSDDNRGFWTIKIAEIIGKEADFSKENIKDNFVGICNVRHTPLLWNYWHFTILWETDKIIWENLNEKQLEKLQKRLGAEARNIIRQYAKIETPPYVTLDPIYYIK